MPKIKRRELDLKTRPVAFVCRRCLRRSGVKPGKLRKRLTAAVRAALDDRRVRVADTSCLGVCPKDGVTVLLAGEIGGAAARAHILPAADCEREIPLLVMTTRDAAAAN